jgi:hypothetical protein
MSYLSAIPDPRGVQDFIIDLTVDKYQIHWFHTTPFKKPPQYVTKIPNSPKINSKLYTILIIILNENDP